MKLTILAIMLLTNLAWAGLLRRTKIMERVAREHDELKLRMMEEAEEYDIEVQYGAARCGSLMF